MTSWERGRENEREGQIEEQQGRMRGDIGEEMRGAAKDLGGKVEQGLDNIGDTLSGKHDGLEAGAAHLVDRQCGDMVTEAAIERSLAGRILAVARLDDVAHDALVDKGRIDPGARHRLPDDQCAQLRRREVLETAEKLSGRCANGRENDG